LLGQLAAIGLVGGWWLVLPFDQEHTVANYLKDALLHLVL